MEEAEKYLKELKSKIDWVKITLWTILIVLSLLLFKSCEGSNELQLTNAIYKKEAKILQQDSQKYVDIANKYRDSVIILKNKKPKIQKEIVYIQKKTAEKLKSIPALTTKGIATYFQDLYKIPVTITQYGVAVPDTLCKAIITDLIRGQGYKAQLKFTQQLLSVETKIGVVKDTIIVNQDKALVKKDSALVVKDVIIKNAEKSVRKQRNKKTFWKVATGIAVTIATYLAVKP